MNRKDILNAKPKVKSIEAFGGTVYIKRLSAGQREAWEQFGLKLAEDKTGNKQIRQRFLIETVCDENGVLQFTEDDLDAISSLDGEEVDNVFSESLEWSGMKTKSVDDIEKK